MSDPEQKCIDKETLDLDFFEVASALNDNSIFFDLGANMVCTFGLLPDLSSAQFHLFEANESLVRTIEKSTFHKSNFLLINMHIRWGWLLKFHLEPSQWTIPCCDSIGKGH